MAGLSVSRRRTGSTAPPRTPSGSGWQIKAQVRHRKSTWTPGRGSGIADDSGLQRTGYRSGSVRRHLRSGTGRACLTRCEERVGGTRMTTELLWHRIQFAFTVTYHYLFPQLTMGLVLLKVRAIRTSNQRYNELARFWGRIFGLNFAMGVVTGIPLEFQFGTNWARFSRGSGEIIGQ